MQNYAYVQLSLPSTLLVTKAFLTCAC